MSDKNNEKIVENGEELHKFMVSQGLEDYNKIPVERIKFNRGVKVVFWFLRGYIIVMILLVIIGFTHVI